VTSEANITVDVDEGTRIDSRMPGSDGPALVWVGQMTLRLAQRELRDAEASLSWLSDAEEHLRRLRIAMERRVEELWAEQTTPRVFLTIEESEDRQLWVLWVERLDVGPEAGHVIITPGEAPLGTPHEKAFEWVRSVQKEPVTFERMSDSFHLHPTYLRVLVGEADSETPAASSPEAPSGRALAAPCGR
jgi:hypothetical protein